MCGKNELLRGMWEKKHLGVNSGEGNPLNIAIVVESKLDYFWGDIRDGATHKAGWSSS